LVGADDGPGTTSSQAGASGDGSEVVMLEQPCAPGKPTISSTIRHMKCRYVQGCDTPVFHHGTCSDCAAIPKERDFRERVKRPYAPAQAAIGANLRSVVVVCMTRGLHLPAT
jgi:hypothetical protein